MSYLYITENGVTVSFEANYVKVRNHDGITRDIPIETLESISVFTKAQITTQCIIECMKKGIPISYYSFGGNYYGRAESVNHVQVERQRKQAKLYDTDFALNLGKEILQAKVKNQEALLRRYVRSKECDLTEELKMMDICQRKMKKSKSYNQLMGYEGNAAKYYFQGLSKIVDEKFQFPKRSKRPPLDEFNAMLSMGYSILMKEIYGIIVSKGLNPYFGFIHRDHEKHPTLASDMMEEWRAIIVDAVTMSLVNGHEIQLDHFRHDADNPGCFLDKEGMKIYINKLERKQQTETKYLSYIDYPVSFRRAIELQINNLAKAIEEENASLYQPMRIR